MVDLAGSDAVYVIVGVVVIAVASLLGLVIFASREEKFEDVVAAKKKETEALLEYLTTGSRSSKSKKKPYKRKGKGAKVDIVDEENSVAGEQVAEKTTALEVLPQETSDVSDANPKVDQDAAQTKKKKKKHASKKESGQEKKPLKDVVQEELLLVEEQLAVEAIDDIPAFADGPDSVPDLDSGVPGQDSIQSAFDQELISQLVKAVKLEESPAKSESSKEVSTPGLSNKKKKKPKSQQSTKGGNGSFLNCDELLNQVEHAQLGNSEVQILIDALFEKQNDLLQWQKPNQKPEHKIDYKKQAEELESMLGEERRTSQVMAQKVKELRVEVNNERNQMQHLQNQAKAKMGQQTKEIQSLQKKIENSREKHLAEMQSAQTQIQRMQELIDGNSSVEVQRLKEEIAHLKTASMRVQQLMEDNQSLMNELSQLQQSNKQLRGEVDSSLQQMTAYEVEMKKLQIDKGEKETVLSKRLQEVNEQLLRSEGTNQSLSASLEAVQKELEELRNVQIEQAQQAINQTVTDGGDSTQLQALFDDATKEIGGLKSSLKIAQDKLKEAQESEDEKSKLIDKLELQLSEHKEKLTSFEDSTAKQINGVSSGDDDISNSHSAGIKDKDAINLAEELKTAEEELVKVKVELQTVTSHKDAVIKNLEVELDQLKAQKSDSSSQQTDMVEELKTDIAERKVELKKIEAVVEQLKSKNNELREKNWKAMDAVGVAESNAKTQIMELRKTTIDFLASVHPDVVIGKDEPIDTIFEKYRHGVQSLLTKNNNNDDIEALKEENKILMKKIEGMETESANSQCLVEMEEKLQKAVSEEKHATLQAEHYKKVLEETESMLTKLKDGVEAEVASWKYKVESKDIELKEAQEKIDDLKGQLAKKEEEDEQQRDLKENTDQIKDDNEKLLQDISSLKVDMEAVKSEKSKLETENARIQDELLKLEKEKDEYQSCLSSQTDQINILEQEKVTLTEDLQKKIADLFKEATEAGSEVKVLQDKVKSLEKAASTEHSSEDKDAIIKQLTVENADLVEQLREERDRVIVDVEIPGGNREQLATELTATKDELEGEKNKAENLKETIKQLENQVSTIQADVQTKEQACNEATEKAKAFEDKYKSATEKLAIVEEKVKELENENLTKSQQIEKEIKDAMSQSIESPDSPQREVGPPLTQLIDELKTSLAEKDKQLEAERLANRQLRVKIASLTPSDASHGTSV